ncbi:MAG: bifunctional pyr operon transcriptional regulator/uracil phosphoribosyltransferase PyrR [Clostridia bacterium]|nr:bifunctional pyr operon transcriptional regulator/uracil phosphoribosyltransferase PyrR [Clostridia bacterium]
MKRKALIMDEAAIDRAIARITHEVIERNRGAEELCLLGIRRRGVPLAHRLADNIQKFEGVSVPVWHLDVTLHRDDRSERERQAVGAFCRLPIDIQEKTVILVDDVLYTGRTARAALEAVFANGRPRSVQLAVLVDRGHRELPIRPDYVGKNVPTAKSELVAVAVKEVDGENGVFICDRDFQDENEKEWEKK